MHTLSRLINDSRKFAKLCRFCFRHGYPLEFGRAGTLVLGCTRILPVQFFFYSFLSFLFNSDEGEEGEEERRVAYTMVSLPVLRLENQSKSRLTVCVES